MPVVVAFCASFEQENVSEGSLNQDGKERIKMGYLPPSQIEIILIFSINHNQIFHEKNFHYLLK